MKPGSLSHALGSAMGARVGMAVLNYGLFWMLSHRLGTAALGGYSLLMNVFYLASTLPMLGVSIALTRRAATERGNVGAEMSNAIVFSAPVAFLLLLAIGTAGTAGYGPELEAPFWLLALSVLPTASALVSESTLMGLERVADIARVQFVETLLRTAFALAAVAFGYGLTGVFAVFAALRFGVALAYRFHPLLPRFEWRQVTRALQARNWREVPVFLGIALLAAVSGRIDIIALSRLSGLQVAGVYAAASRLYDASLMLPNIAALSVMPTLARLFVEDKAYFREVLVLSMRLSLGVGFAIALGVAALAEPVIHLLYRPEMAAAAAVLRWLIFCAVLVTLDQILSSTMLAAKAQAHDLGSLTIAVVVLVAGLLVLVPILGAVGAAMAVVLATACRVAYRLAWIVRLLELPHLGRDLGRVLASTAIALAALAAALPHGAPAALAASLAAYLAGLLASGALRPGEIAGARRRLAALVGRRAS
jgi:O-antigen/teichoic acid export membrane protein